MLSWASIKCVLYITLALKLLRKMKDQYAFLNEKFLIIRCIPDNITTVLQN